MTIFIGLVLLFAGVTVALAVVCCLVGRTCGLCPECVSCLSGMVFRGVAKCFCCAKKHTAETNFFLRAMVPDSPEISRLAGKKDASDDEHVPSFLRVPFKTDLLQSKDQKATAKNPYWDAVFIGSGTAGLAGASFAAQLGKKALVLEKSERAGGMLSTFKQDGFEFGVGMHWTLSMFPLWAAWQRATEGRCHFAPKSARSERPREPYDILHFENDEEGLVGVDDDDRRVDLHCGVDACRESLLKQFPSEREGLIKYFNDVEASLRERPFVMLLRYVVPAFLRGFVERLFECVKRVRSFALCRITSKEYFHDLFPNSPALRCILGGTAGFLGGKYEELPAYFSVVVLAVQIAGGDSGTEGKLYPVGGPQKVAIALGQSVVKHGGQIFSYADVKKILVDGKRDRAIGVRMADGTVIYAKHVVAACGIANTFAMLPKELCPPKQVVARATRPSLHLSGAFLGFDSDYRKLGLPSSDIWLVRGAAEDFEKITTSCVAGPDPMGCNMAFVTNPNSVHSSPGRTSLAIFIPSNYEHFKRWEHTRIKQRGPEYEDLKESIFEPFLDQLFKLYPKLKDHLVHQNFATCLSGKYWTNWPTGECYGAVNDMDRRYAMYDTCVRGMNRKVKGLVISSADFWAMASVSGALMAGLISARIITGRDLLGELTRGPKEEMKKVFGEFMVEESS